MSNLVFSIQLMESLTKVRSSGHSVQPQLGRDILRLRTLPVAITSGMQAAQEDAIHEERVLICSLWPS